MYLINTPWWLRKLYSSDLIWDIKTTKQEFFLTFDDGPHPTITPFVLACLKRFNAKGTFFCIGKNVTRYPHVYQQIINEGHTVANHTYNHLNGWKTGDTTYLKNVIMAQQVIESSLFRPPYGRITKSQASELAPVFKIIMWSVLSGDFDNSISPQRCFDNVVANVKAGSIIVFHDSEKAFPRLEFALPRVLEYYKKRNFSMNKLT